MSASREAAVEAGMCYPIAAISQPTSVPYPMAVTSVPYAMAVTSVAETMSIAVAWMISVVPMGIVPVPVNTVRRTIAKADGGRIAISVNFRRIAVTVRCWSVVVTV